MLALSGGGQGGGGGEEVVGLSFRSQPGLDPPAVELASPTSSRAAPGYVFIAPKRGAAGNGPMIVDDRGEPVWFRDLPGDSGAADLRVQRYRGEPVLTWWEGDLFRGYGEGEFVIADTSYREITRVRMGNGLRGDLHEFLITPRGTALVMGYPTTPRDLSPVGGPPDGTVLGSVVQEIDIESGEVLFEWDAADHVDLDESYESVPDSPEDSYDFFHLNSIAEDDDGNLLLSARHTHAIYKIDRDTGDVIWRLGGKESDFRMGPGTLFQTQHDARRLPDGTLSLFDNGVPPGTTDSVTPGTDGESRGLVLRLDERRMTAEVVREYAHPMGWLSETQGNMQTLPNGNVFVGYGSKPGISEFSRDGRLLFDGRLPEGYDNYRAYRFRWTGRPAEPPAAVAEPGDDGGVTVYASWNGATEVAEWEVLAGPAPEELAPVGGGRRTGFETAITVETDEPFVAARALDRAGRKLGTSAAVEVGG